jgi:hypothetical protein
LDKAQITPNQPLIFIASTELANGQFSWAKLSEPVTDIKLLANANDRQLDVKKAQLSLFGGAADAKMVVNEIQSTQPQGRVEFKVENIDFARATSSPGRSARLNGKLATNFNGGFTGKSGDEITQTLSGRGAFVLQDGVILDANPLRDVLEKLKVIPGVAEGLDKHLPEAVRKRMLLPNTPLLEPIKNEFEIRNGQIYLQKLILPTEFFVVQSDVVVGLNGNVSGTGSFIIGPVVSNAIAQGSDLTQALADKDGTISLPVKFGYESGRFWIVPDLRKFSVNALATQGQALLEDFLSKSRDADPSQTAPVDSNTATSSQGAGSSLRDLLLDKLNEVQL